MVEKYKNNIKYDDDEDIDEDDEEDEEKEEEDDEEDIDEEDDDDDREDDNEDIDEEDIDEEERKEEERKEKERKEKERKEKERKEVRKVMEKVTKPTIREKRSTQRRVITGPKVPFKRPLTPSVLVPQRVKPRSLTGGEIEPISPSSLTLSPVRLKEPTELETLRISIPTSKPFSVPVVSQLSPPRPIKEIETKYREKSQIQDEIIEERVDDTPERENKGTQFKPLRLLPPRQKKRTTSKDRRLQLLEEISKQKRIGKREQSVRIERDLVSAFEYQTYEIDLSPIQEIIDYFNSIEESNEIDNIDEAVEILESLVSLLESIDQSLLFETVEIKFSPELERIGLNSVLDNLYQNRDQYLELVETLKEKIPIMTQIDSELAFQISQVIEQFDSSSERKSLSEMISLIFPGFRISQDLEELDSTQYFTQMSKELGITEKKLREDLVNYFQGLKENNLDNYNNRIEKIISSCPSIESEEIFFENFELILLQPCQNQSDDCSTCLNGSPEFDLDLANLYQTPIIQILTSRDPNLIQFNISLSNSESPKDDRFIIYLDDQNQYFRVNVEN